MTHTQKHDFTPSMEDDATLVCTRKGCRATVCGGITLGVDESCPVTGEIMSIEIDGRTIPVEAPPMKIDWKRYPKLATWFENRPRVNVYWQDLERLIADAKNEGAKEERQRQFVNRPS